MELPRGFRRLGGVRPGRSSFPAGGSDTMTRSARRVVLVDDCDDLRLIVRVLLTRAGYEVVAEARDGMAGVLAAGSSAPDVVLLDLDMPVLDGWGALPLLRTAAPHARIVVFSHDVTLASLERLHSLGAHGAVRKGSRLRDVLAAVDSALFEQRGDRFLEKVE